MANVRTTRQITKAMDMVASTKLQSARRRLAGVRPLYNELNQIMDNLKKEEEVVDHVFMKQGEVKNSAYIVISSDKGLCGSYNTAVSKEALNHMENRENEIIFAIGSRGIEYLRSHEKTILRRITNVTEAQVYKGTERLSEEILSMYLSGEFDEVFVVYTYFENTLNREPRVKRILPISDHIDEAKDETDMKYEQGATTFLEHIMPLYLHTCLFALMSESLASEHAARMMSMESASKNASDIIDELNLMYNRKRQAAITQELTEIVGGANILK